ncbi:MAG: DUF4174 domain-containing protein [Nitriliruptorales bacterium]|nr:DUF4174 domain-containing protein [Nitriliruptorales bacterium]
MAQPDAFDLMVYRWRRRLLLIFSPSATEPAYQRQMSLLGGEQSALAQRELLLVHLIAKEPSRLEVQRLPPGTAEDLRAQFAVEDTTFAVVLIGLDGTAKRRSAEPMPPADIFAAIDAIPMRQHTLWQRHERH